jgi:hypothetical protein
MDVWHGDEALTDMFPALYSHCTDKDASVSDMVVSGVRQKLVPRLSGRALRELQDAEEILHHTQLLQTRDQRSLPFCKANNNLDSGAIYQLLKARGQPNDEKATFIWQNSALPRVQMFMWLLWFSVASNAALSSRRNMWCMMPSAKFAMKRTRPRST